MKFALLFLSFAVGCFAFASGPITKQVPVENVFIPSGFDDNDAVEIVVTGYLPNLCYKSPGYSIEIKGNTIEVSVHSLFYYSKSLHCAEMIVPFMEVVSLGVLKQGSYDVVVNRKTDMSKKGELNISAAQTSSADNFNYAYVNYIEVTEDKNKIKLKGHSVSDCFILDRIDHKSNGKDTYSILPKLKQISDFCPMKMVPFTEEYELPQELKASKILLHVRTLNGKSYNRVISN